MTQGKDFRAVPFHLFRCLLIIRLPRRLLANNFRSSLDEGRIIRSDPSSFALSGPVNKRHIGDEGDAKTHRTPKVIADYGRYRKVKLESCSRSPSIQPSRARVTPVDWRYVSQESRQSGVTRMWIPSTRSNTHGISHNSARICRPILTRRP